VGYGNAWGLPPTAVIYPARKGGRSTMRSPVITAYFGSRYAFSPLALSYCFHIRAVGNWWLDSLIVHHQPLGSKRLQQYEIVMRPSSSSGRGKQALTSYRDPRERHSTLNSSRASAMHLKPLYVSLVVEMTAAATGNQLTHIRSFAESAHAFIGYYLLTSRSAS
jgi:hypothetical protein